MRPSSALHVFVLFPVTCLAAALPSPDSPPPLKKLVFGSSYVDLQDFEQFAVRAKASGATHVNVSGDLPWSYWEYDQPNDPYPSWVISHPEILKITRPPALQKYIPAEHGARVLALLEQRGQILRKLGLKAVLSVNEPSMLPEAVFTDHPLWRGARVDHPARSRVARFAPTIDHPEVLALFREGVQILLKHCPEIDQLDITTNDSGAGLDWSPGLYSGRIGNTLYRERTMDERIRGFFDTLQNAARDSGHELEIHMALTREPEPLRVVRKLAPGTGIENLEGPDATPFARGAGFGEGYGNAFNPVTGIPLPVLFLDGLAGSDRGSAPRLRVSMGDRRNRDLYFAIYDRYRAAPVRDAISRLQLLRAIAAERVGEEHAEQLLTLWTQIEDDRKLIRLLDTGGIIFYLGSVQQRWLTRPFVPVPSELKPEEKSYYRRFLFQALDEAHAESLSDVQATDVYGGWSGRHFVRRVLDPVDASLGRSIPLARTIGDEDLARRLEIFRCVVRNARNAVSYQAQLDRVRRLGTPLDPSPVVETQSGWDRQLMMETAREEVDNTAVLMQLLGPRPADYLLLAARPEEEDCRLIGPDVAHQLQLKLNIMNSRWEDYKRLFTTPNW